METFIIALGLVLVIEGSGPLLFPNKWANYLKQLAQLPVAQLRQIGGVLVVFGTIVLLFSL